jgi:hypothetical protein
MSPGDGSQHLFSYSLIDPTGYECPLSPESPPTPPALPPLPPPNPPAPPTHPTAEQCEADALTEINKLYQNVECRSEAQMAKEEVMERLNAVLPECAEDSCSPSSSSSETAASILALIPSIIGRRMQAEGCGADGECTVNPNKDTWKETAQEALPGILSKMCPCVTTPPPEGEPCDEKCEKNKKYWRYCESKSQTESQCE